MRNALWLGLASIWLSAPAFAQEDCAPKITVDAGIAAETGPTFKTGDLASVILKPEPQVHFSVAAHGTDNPQNWGGVLVFDVPTTGTWRVGLSGGAWISALQDGAEVRSSAHQHGEKCITKMVDFPLKAGRAIIELSAASQPKLGVEISLIK